jgi:hypothetical protein
MAGAPAAAMRGRRRRLGVKGWGGEGTALGQPDPAPYIASRNQAGLSGQSDPDNPAPPNIPPWGQIFWPGAPELKHLVNFSKTDVILTKTLNSCAKIRCLEIGWLR